ncbi:polysaccharide pyruvyl transferase family protein [Aureimonas sp. SA4125]|uniref:polysaccharide pyruvyl transferase family protein n=1 Tax=Aureimonas sp. SA4125 TaxID=2826993 RepID=UPI001CC5C9E9|nr:polysaccharide pyruvyl transferase family protein [Aureimonas sp. SA4125]
MQFPEIERLHVFSSGVGYLPVDRHDSNRQVWCVRGPLSAEQLGIDADKALTDGAILSPRLYPKPSTSLGTVVIPHWETLLHNDWDSVCRNAGMTLIDPMGAVSDVIPKIASAKLVLTESLHGAIIADTYGIPWIAFTTNKSFSVFKWTDWTRSVGLPLKLRVIAPPSGEVLLRMGMPTLGRWGQAVEPTQAQLTNEITQRVAPRHAAVAPPPKGGVAAALKQQAKKFVLGNQVTARLMGIGAEMTAQQLTDLAKTETPSLSTAERRAELTERMLGRLLDLCRTQGVEPKL